MCQLNIGICAFIEKKTEKVLWVRKIVVPLHRI